MQSTQAKPSPKGIVSRIAASRAMQKRPIKAVIAIVAALIVLTLATIIYAEGRKRTWEIKSKSGNVFETASLRGGPWPGPMTDLQKIHMYADCAALSEDVYNRTDPTIKPPKEWVFVKPEEVMLAAGTSRDEWAKFFPNDDDDMRAFAFKVWEKTLPDRIDVVIAFRGTNDREDWKSNFRWFRKKYTGKEDQYDLVKQLAPKLVDAIRRRHPADKINFISTGHSLGGGLAQQAAYATSSIKEVYAFDPSPVTGYKSTEGAADNAKGIKIDRIYERGEGLSYVRALIRPFYELTDENPNITEIGFNFEKVGHSNWWLYFIRQHGMTDLARHLQELDKRTSRE